MEQKLRIKELCKLKGVALGKLATEIGMTQNALSYIVNEKVSTSYSTLIKIAEVLGVSVGELFSDYEPKFYCPKCGAMLEVRLVEDGHSEAEQQ